MDDAQKVSYTEMNDSQKLEPFGDRDRRSLPVTHFSNAPMTHEEARQLTNRIKEKAEELWALVLEAYERKAYRALGYTAWADYLDAELGMRPGGAQNLITKARLVRELRENFPVGNSDTDLSGSITQNVAETLNSDPVALDEVRTRLQEGEEADTAIRDAMTNHDRRRTGLGHDALVIHRIRSRVEEELSTCLNEIPNRDFDNQERESLLKGYLKVQKMLAKVVARLQGEPNQEEEDNS